MSRKQAEEVLIQKASADEAFRKRLKADPKGTVAAEFSVRFSDRFKIHVVEESDSEIYVVLPAPAVHPRQAELTDQELADIAGGQSAADSGKVTRPRTRGSGGE